MRRELNPIGDCRRFYDAKGVPLVTVYDDVRPRYRPHTRPRRLAGNRLVSGAALTVFALLTLWLAMFSR